jgi:hypothetical protein
MMLVRTLATLLFLSAIAQQAESQSPTSTEQEGPAGMARFYVYGGDGTQQAYFTEHLVGRLPKKSYFVYDTRPGLGNWYVGYVARLPSGACCAYKAGELLSVDAEAGRTFYLRVHDDSFELAPKEVARSELNRLKRVAVPPGVLQIESEIAAVGPTVEAKPFPWPVSWSNGCSDPSAIWGFGECLTQGVRPYFEDDALNLQLIGLRSGEDQASGRGLRIKYRDIRDVGRRRSTGVILTRADGRVDVLTTYIPRPGNYSFRFTTQKTNAADEFVEELRRRMSQADASR